MVNGYYNDFLRRVKLSESRLNGETYRFGRVFREKEYDWEGDWEGRALLAFVCLKRLTGRENPTLAYELSHLKEHMNRYGYFGAEADGERVSEQQLSGNGWYLRGLCEYFEDTGDREVLSLIQSVTEHLYLKNAELYRRYPEGSRGETGGVSGSAAGEAEGWKLSSDVGCAFIALDGLTAAYKILRTERLKTFISERIAQFMRFDKLKCKMQTHATLTVCRAILRMYLLTREQQYLAAAEELFGLYLRHGITLTYENFNWFCREDTWTEPCAVTDSLIVALYLHRETGEEKYSKLARRIYFNGFCMGQRQNGGAGPNACVTKTQPYFGMKMYEAEFCCSMRYAEGLYRVSEFAEILFSDNNEEKEITREDLGGAVRYFRGDRLLCSENGGKLKELPDVTAYSENELKNLRLKVVFGEGEKVW